MLYVVLSVNLAYLIGSINFAVIFSKLFIKEDIRNYGSGNAGATNVLRVGGPLPGILTFVFDAFKGFVACFTGKLLIEKLAEGTISPLVGAFICGLACMLGHVFPIFFRFKGGKGVATAVGIFSVCCPIAIILGLICFALVMVLSRIVSLSSLLATVTVVVCTAIFHDSTVALLPQILLSVAMGALVFIKHIDNIKRLAKGEEKKLNIGSKK
ncbi:MAG: glycerol-3-phosphate 1-O-acyltransferase PlsY [Clostridia bacterium]|nr:glycerol-3-phosphate 1-O-acyltransferase PlsY [Clostridia bacterium]